jgi:hypothetical protein
MAPKKRAKKAADWREPIFYWRGTVDSSSIGSDVWEGTWVASAEGLPTAEEFKASENTFSLTCSDALGMLVMTEEDGRFFGSYKLDNGGGPEDFSDIEQTIRVVEGPAVGGPMGDAEWCNVGARGTTEFGEFVSLGTLERGTNLLTLARRYISDDDPRCEMSAAEVVGRVEEGGEDQDHTAEPWGALPYKVPEDWPASLPAPPPPPGAESGDHD